MWLFPFQTIPHQKQSDMIVVSDSMLKRMSSLILNTTITKCSFPGARVETIREGIHPDEKF